jgi:putative membrane protein
MARAAANPAPDMNSRPSSNLSGFLQFLGRWTITTLAVVVASQLVYGIHYESTTGLVVAALLLGILNAVLRPLLLLLSLPLLVLTLGLFTLVINALLLYLVGSLVKGFHVDGFWPAFWGGLVVSVVSLILNALTGVGTTQIRVQRGRRGPPPQHPPDTGSGPVIDV